MTHTQNRILDDIARLAADAAGLAQSARSEVEMILRAQMERFLNDMNLVPREEFDVVKDIATRARDEADILRTEIMHLQNEIKSLKRPPKRLPQQTARKKTIPQKSKKSSDT